MLIVSFKANVSTKKSILTGISNTELERTVFLNVIGISSTEMELFWIYTSATPVTFDPTPRV